MARRRARHLGWTKVREGTHGGCGAVWQHVSGWQVLHCGHPTANYPWYGVSPDGEEILLSAGIDKGMAFRWLAAAQEAVEVEVLKRTL